MDESALTFEEFDVLVDTRLTLNPGNLFEPATYVDVESTIQRIISECLIYKKKGADYKAIAKVADKQLTASGLGEVTQYRDFWNLDDKIERTFFEKIIGLIK